MMKPANVLSRVGYYHASSFSVLVVHLRHLWSFTFHLPFNHHPSPPHSIHLFSFIIGLTRIWPRFIRMSSSCQVDKKKKNRDSPCCSGAAKHATPSSGTAGGTGTAGAVDVTHSMALRWIGLCPEFPFRTDIDMNLNYWIFMNIRYYNVKCSLVFICIYNMYIYIYMYVCG